MNIGTRFTQSCQLALISSGVIFISVEGCACLASLSPWLPRKHNTIVYCSALKGGVSGWECNPILEAVRLFMGDVWND